MKSKCLKVMVTILLLEFSLYAQEINSKAGIQGTNYKTVEDNTSELINYLSSLAQNSDNALFTYHCNSIINVIRAKSELMTYEISNINKIFSTFTDTAVSWNASNLSSYLERKRPFIISWTSPTDGTVSLAWLIPPANWEPEKAYPLYVSLHGLYNSYSNHIEFMSTYLSPAVILNQTFDDGYFVYPWARGNLWYEGISETDVWEAISTVESVVKIDTSRKYLFGHSMGGYGAWMIGQNSPEKWAAIGIYAGAWWNTRSKYLSSSIAENLKNVPVYIVCGTSDGYLNDNKKACSLLQAAGNSNVLLTTFSGGHDPLLENWQKMYEWIRQWTNQNSTAVSSDELNMNMKLFDNYPNPFNPETVISYRLSVFSHATLKVYDVLGKEVATLVNEQQQPGYYQVKFSAGTIADGHNLTSGVYFYRLTAGNFSETKKFLLLK
jgi:pimeloyl-ACP methyl ester carboxylesterase